VLDGNTSTDPDTLAAAYSTMLTKNLLDPLGMSATHLFDEAKDPKKLPYAYNSATGAEALGYNTTWPAYFGAGGIVSNASNMAKYIEFNLGMTKSKLNPVLSVTQTSQGGPKPPSGQEVGLGWFLGTLPGSSSIPVVDKNGAVPGFTSLLLMSPASKTGGTNTGVFVVVNEGDQTSGTTGVPQVAVDVMQMLNGVTVTGSPVGLGE
jgi:CubicO group peptidase (beta-lactamase class C family)